jgi:hypothetical protein
MRFIASRKVETINSKDIDGRVSNDSAFFHLFIVVIDFLLKVHTSAMILLTASHDLQT